MGDGFSEPNKSALPYGSVQQFVCPTPRQALPGIPAISDMGDTSQFVCPPSKRGIYEDLERMPDKRAALSFVLKYPLPIDPMYRRIGMVGIYSREFGV